MYAFFWIVPILAVHGNENDEQKTVFEKVINELQNIEYALNYLMKVYQENRKKRESQIETNSMCLSDDISQISNLIIDKYGV